MLEGLEWEYMLFAYHRLWLVPAGLSAQTTVPIFISTFALALQIYLKIMNPKRYASIVT